ncbi:hypothetical protein P879_04325 [Paragonimus westermani]|uniref:Tetratricopeptide repeat protein n=1 Tax=Paragonimus westermani TaxID=34504 RepID=A0A8T0DVX1_9TREM|nr:hypothetical protein P879_04325 [Paragonimus westermani]
MVALSPHPNLSPPTNKPVRNHTIPEIEWIRQIWQPSSPRKRRRQRKVTWRSGSTPSKPSPDEPADLFVLNPKDVTLIHAIQEQQRIRRRSEISVDWTTPVLLPDSIDIRNTDLGEKAPDTALKIGVLAQAKADLMTAINRLPQLVSAYWQLHLVSLIEGNVDQALNHLDRYLKCTLSVRNPQANKSKKQLEVAYLFKIKIHQLLNDPQSELLAWRELILLNPKQYSYYRQRALLLLKLNQPIDAFADLEKTLSLNPVDKEARLEHALYYFKNRNWASASNCFQQFTELWPDDSEARAYLGRTWMHLKRHAEALAELTASLYFTPLNVEAIQTTFTGWKVYLCRAEAYHALGKVSNSSISDVE